MCTSSKWGKQCKANEEVDEQRRLLSQPSCDVLLKGNYSWRAAHPVRLPGWQVVPVLWWGAGMFIFWEQKAAPSPGSPAVASSLCLGLGPSGRECLVSLLTFVLGWIHHCADTRDHAVQSSAGAEAAPGHRQGWSLLLFVPLPAELLSISQSCGARAGL